MIEDTPIHNGQTFLITTDDGTLFSCTPYTFRMRGECEDRWRLLGTKGDTHCGPRYDRRATPVDVQRAVSVWWSEQHAQTRHV